MSAYVDGLVKKWDGILAEGEDIGSKKVRKATAIMLENQMNYLTGNSGSGMVSETTASGGVMGGGDGYSSDQFGIQIRGLN